MQKWEYNIIPLHKFDDETSSFAAVKLTRQYGKKGWELVQIIDGLAYFKRPIDEAARNREKTSWNEEVQTWRIDDNL